MPSSTVTKVLNCSGSGCILQQSGGGSIDHIPDGVEVLKVSNNPDIRRITGIPPTLTSLILSDCNVVFDSDDPQWANIRYLDYDDAAVFPNLASFHALECLLAADCVAGAFFPDSIRCMTISITTLDASVLPRSLESLHLLGSGFEAESDTLKTVRAESYPTGLARMVITGMVVSRWDDAFPMWLTDLRFVDVTFVRGHLFSEVLPDTIRTLMFIRTRHANGSCLRLTKLPRALKTLKLHCDMDQNVCAINLPEGLEFLGIYHSEIRELPVLPASLRTLLLVCCGQIDEFSGLPPNLTALVLYKTWTDDWDEIEVPASMQLLQSSGNDYADVTHGFPVYFMHEEGMVYLRHGAVRYFFEQYMARSSRFRPCKWCNDKYLESEIKSYIRTNCGWDTHIVTRERVLALLYAARVNALRLPVDLVRLVGEWCLPSLRN